MKRQDKDVILYLAIMMIMAVALYVFVTWFSG